MLKSFTGCTLGSSDPALPQVSPSQRHQPSAHGPQGKGAVPGPCPTAGSSGCFKINRRADGEADYCSSQGDDADVPASCWLSIRINQEMVRHMISEATAPPGKREGRREKQLCKMSCQRCGCLQRQEKLPVKGRLFKKKSRNGLRVWVFICTHVLLCSCTVPSS